jgi:ribonuclease HI
MQRLASIAWVIFTPHGQLLSSGGICLGDTTNNVTEYSAVIELLRDALSLGISHLRVYLDAQLVMSQLNRVYRVHDPTLHQRFLRVHLLERNFDYITYFHVPRRLNQITDTLANQILDPHITEHGHKHVNTFLHTESIRHKMIKTIYKHHKITRVHRWTQAPQNGE